VKVLVTGGAGFIGSHIVDKLIQSNYQVIVIDNLSTGLRENINRSATFIEMDICSDKILELFETERFDYVIHQAAQTMVPQSIAMPDYDCQVNILGTVNVLEACRKTGVKRIICASTAAVYGNVADVPVLESTVTRPTSFYGLSKLAVERYLSLYNQVFGLEYAALRYANVYGERQGDAGEGGVISIFTRKIHHKQAVSIYGDGGQTRDFIYVGDVAAANVKALTAKKCNDAYNISTQTETSINTLVELMSKIAGNEFPKKYEQPREGDIYRSSLSNAAARHHLNWQPEMPLLDGLARTYYSLTNKL